MTVAAGLDQKVVRAPLAKLCHAPIERTSLRRAARRTLVAAGLIGASALAGLTPTPAQDCPFKPDKLVIPIPAGGVICANAVAKSAADGYTLVLVDVFHSSMPIHTRKVACDALKDFTPVSLIGRSPAFPVAGPSFEPKTAKKAIAWAKANPWKMTMAIAGVGGVVVDLFKARTGNNIVSVPYKGSSPALADLMSGQVQVMITTMASAVTNVNAGKLRALAATGSKRFADLPDVPTFDELGIKGMDYEQWFGILGPAGMPKSLIDKLVTAMDQVTRMPDARAPGQHGAERRGTWRRRAEASARGRRRMGGKLA